MAEDYFFPPADGSPPEPGAAAVARLATPAQWAAMSFAPVLIDAGKFDAEWEHARGVVARTAIALLRFDDQELTHHFMNQPEPLRGVMEAHADLQRELDYLKTHVEALEMASARLLCVASRCAEQSAP